MRDTILGIVLAVAFLGGLFAVAHYGPRPLSSSPARALAVQPLRPGFYGIQRDGAWTLECLKRHQIPAWAVRMAAAAAKSKGEPVRPQARSPLCHVITRITRPGPNGAWMIDVIFSLTPKGGFLTALMRLAPELASPGDYLTLHLSAGDQRVRVLLCGPPECIAVPVVRPVDIPKMKVPQAELIAASKMAVLSFPASPGQKQHAFRIPLDGLRPALAAMHRISGEQHS